MSEMVQLASAQRTFSLFLAHDVGSILLELLELSPGHGVLRLLFEGVSPWTGASRFFDAGVYRDEPETPPSSAPWPDRCHAGYPVSWWIGIMTAKCQEKCRADAEG